MTLPTLSTPTTSTFLPLGIWVAATITTTTRAIRAAARRLSSREAGAVVVILAQRRRYPVNTGTPGKGAGMAITVLGRMTCPETLTTATGDETEEEEAEEAKEEGDSGGKTFSFTCT